VIITRELHEKALSAAMNNFVGPKPAMQRAFRQAMDTALQTVYIVLGISIVPLSGDEPGDAN
jgi:hypothetical protein